MNNVTTVETPATDNSQLQVWATNTSQLSNWANTLLITKQEDFEETNRRLLVLRDLLKAMEAEKERRYRPIKIALKQVEDDFNPHIKTLTAVEKTARSKMATYDAAVQAQKRKEEERLAEERRQQALKDAQESEAALAQQTALLKQEADARAAEAAAAGDTDMAEAIKKQTEDGLASIANAHEKMVEERFKAADTVAEVAKTRTTESGTGFTTRMVSKMRVVNPLLVPREYLMVDEAKLKAAFAQATDPKAFNVPGVEVYEEAVGSVVTARKAA